MLNHLIPFNWKPPKGSLYTRVKGNIKKKNVKVKDTSKTEGKQDR